MSICASDNNERHGYYVEHCSSWNGVKQYEVNLVLELLKLYDYIIIT